MRWEVPPRFPPAEGVAIRVRVHVASAEEQVAANAPPTDRWVQKREQVGRLFDGHSALDLGAHWVRLRDRLWELDRDRARQRFFAIVLGAVDVHAAREEGARLRGLETSRSAWPRKLWDELQRLSPSRERRAVEAGEGAEARRRLLLEPIASYGVRDASGRVIREFSVRRFDVLVGHVPHRWMREILGEQAPPGAARRIGKRRGRPTRSADSEEETSRMHLMRELAQALELPATIAAALTVDVESWFIGADGRVEAESIRREWQRTRH